MKKDQIADQANVPPLFGDNEAQINEEVPIMESISVDASCIGNPGPVKYKGVKTNTGMKLFKGSVGWGTNNVGEFLAIVHALVYAHQKGLKCPIYSDSETAIKWVKDKKCKTTLKKTRATKLIFKLIDGSEKILRSIDFTNPILKWETKRWGQIPADFGRK